MQPERLETLVDRIRALEPHAGAEDRADASAVTDDQLRRVLAEVGRRFAESGVSGDREDRYAIRLTTEVEAIIGRGPHDAGDGAHLSRRQGALLQLIEEAFLYLKQTCGLHADAFLPQSEMARDLFEDSGRAIIRACDKAS